MISSLEPAIKMIDHYTILWIIHITNQRLTIARIVMMTTISIMILMLRHHQQLTQMNLDLSWDCLLLRDQIIIFLSEHLQLICNEQGVTLRIGKLLSDG
jgi:hypothetical protein